MLRTSLIVASFIALAGCTTAGTPAQTAADRDCFNADSVSGYSLTDENHITVRVGANRRYALTTMFNARDLDWTQAIALRSTSDWICTGNGLGVEVIGGQPRRNYPISGIERLPDEALVQGS
jgi:hypothetical protein